MTNYEVTLQYLRDMRDDDGMSLEDSLEMISEQMQEGSEEIPEDDLAELESEVNRAVKDFIVECGGNPEDY